MNRHERRKAQKQKPKKVPQLFMEPVSAKNSETGEDELLPRARWQACRLSRPSWNTRSGQMDLARARVPGCRRSS